MRIIFPEPISEEAIFSQMMKIKRKTMVARFSMFPYTPEQIYHMLMASCRVEVLARGRDFKTTASYDKHIKQIAAWLSVKNRPSFGLFLCGNRGNGKSTMVLALKSLYQFLDDSPVGEPGNKFPRPGFEIVSAKELVRLTKAYLNQNKDNSQDVYQYKRLRDKEILSIDDLGTEPRESMNYGDYVTAVMDMVNYRYDHQLTTIATSNLSPGDIKNYYDERFADRFREMMEIINFGNEESFRMSL